MTLKILPKADLADWFDHIRLGHRVFGPKAVQDQFIFAELKSADEMDLGYPTTILPPKKVIAPQREDLLQFNLQEGRIEALIEAEPTVLFGVHTCDLHAMRLLDTVFQRDYPDQHYLSRRKNTILVSIECLAPCNGHSFCKDMNTSTRPDEYDLHLVDIGDAYAVYVGSSVGAGLLDGFIQAGELQASDQRRLNRVMKDRWPRFNQRLQADITELPSLMAASYKSPVWEDIGKRCLGCGACTLVCPTCYCFDMVDDVDFARNAGVRTRVWDSCQLNQFASVAGGHDFRPGKAKRLRHRFFRKYKYQSISPGLVGCVGCGRCAEACLVDITPIEVLNKLYHRRIAAMHNPGEAGRAQWEKEAIPG
jgi:sulfhydrogenase subunit beta (sulfur reductase)